VIDLATNQPVSTEALLRWRHPERGLVGPLDFIPIAEETGLIVEIDRSFVAGVEHDPDDRAIVKPTIDMAHALGLLVVAEGVETREQEDYLRASACNRVQGYLYARPQPAAAITALLLTDGPPARR
jgi:EAL domain-containing protein (putative c-di-GMP-specific phosphodiesterase class I)